MSLRRTLLTLLFLTATAAQALVDASEDADTLIREQIDSRDQAKAAYAPRLEEQARLQAAALERVERLRTLPPEQIQALVEGRTTETAALAMPVHAGTSPSVPAAHEPQTGALPFSGFRLLRLLAVGGFCVILAVAMRRQRRRATEASGPRSEVRVCKR